ncbi:Cation/H(+) antiporter 28, partial [Linum grandiflorum]
WLNILNLLLQILYQSIFHHSTHSSSTQKKRRRKSLKNKTEIQKEKERKEIQFEIKLFFFFFFFFLSSSLWKMEDSLSMNNGTAGKLDPTEESACQNFITYTVKNEPGKIIGLILTYVLSYLLHHLLKPLSQPRIVSDIAIGLIIGNIQWIRNACDPKFIETLNFIAEFGMICHVFALGLEMNPNSIFKSPSQDAMIAYTGMISTILLVCGTVPFLMYTSKMANIGFTGTLAMALAGSGSPILTRIITNLKIGKSDIGNVDNNKKVVKYHIGHINI